MHIAILVTNTDRSDFAARHPRDGEKFTVMLQALRPGWQVTVFDLTQGEFPDRLAGFGSLAGFDGAIIGGSPASVNGAEGWIAQLGPLIRGIVADGLPLFGACFGHQAIARALGGQVADNPGGWVLGVTETRVTEVAPWMTGSPGGLRVNAAHSEQVVALPPGARVLAGNADCPVGVYAIGSRVFATQYHPEMTDGFLAAAVDAFGPKIGDAVYRSARASLSPPAETARFVDWIVRFFEHSR